MEALLYSQEGKEIGKTKIPKGIFDIPWNADLVHEVIRLMNSNSRMNIAHAKTRGEVRGGGKKPWKQKGTGRARHGSSRSPIWVGGGTTHGPRNDKNYTRKINKKALNKALLTILSKKFNEGELLFVDAMNISEPKTKQAKQILISLSKIKGYDRLATKTKNVAIIATSTKQPIVEKSFNNIGSVSIEEFRNINPVSVLNHKYLIINDPETALKLLSSKVKQSQ
ncbi:MAG: 50S ribosomal protein L4 [Candidatus Paceibacterota bacterium]|jgi:large subunit ribosomal protein L4